MYMTLCNNKAIIISFVIKENVWRIMPQDAIGQIFDVSLVSKCNYIK